MRKLSFLLLLAVLFALPVPSLAEGSGRRIPVIFEDGAALVNGDGEEIIPFGQYDTIYWVSGQSETDPAAMRFAAGTLSGDLCLLALIDGTGKALTEPLYEMLAYSGGLIICSQDGLFGALDLSGKELTPPVYTSLTGNGEGGLLALKTDVWDYQADGLYYIDPQGRETATGVKTLSILGEFSEGRLALQSAENSRYGYVDAQGRWLVRPQFSYGGEFSNGRAVASITSGLGLIDLEGSWVLTPRYQYLLCTDDLALATLYANACVVFDLETLKERFRVTGEILYAYDDEDCVMIGDSDSTRLYDAQGALLFSASSEASLSASKKGFILAADGPWGGDRATLRDPKDGSQLGPARQDIYSLGCYEGREYFAYLVMEVDLEGNRYETARYGLMDETGTARTDPIFLNLFSLEEGVLYAETEDQRGVMRPDGEWLHAWPVER